MRQVATGAACLKELRAVLRRHLGIGFRVCGKVLATVRILYIRAD